MPHPGRAQTQLPGSFRTSSGACLREQAKHYATAPVSSSPILISRYTRGPCRSRALRFITRRAGLSSRNTRARITLALAALGPEDSPAVARTHHEGRSPVYRDDSKTPNPSGCRRRIRPQTWRSRCSRSTHRGLASAPTGERAVFCRHHPGKQECTIVAATAATSAHAET